jgi:hypothetical protein
MTNPFSFRSVKELQERDKPCYRIPLSGYKTRMVKRVRYQSGINKEKQGETRRNREKNEERRRKANSYKTWLW